MSLVDKLSSAIARQEGFFASGDPLPKRLNNPGDLIFAGQAGAKEHKVPGRDIGYAQFDTLAYGVVALYRQLWQNIARGATLKTLIESWAPPNENDTQKYLEDMKEWLGIQNEDIPLMNLIVQEWLAS